METESSEKQEMSLPTISTKIENSEPILQEQIGRGDEESAGCEKMDTEQVEIVAKTVKEDSTSEEKPETVDSSGDGSMKSENQPWVLKDPIAQSVAFLEYPLKDPCESQSVQTQTDADGTDCTPPKSGACKGCKDLKCTQLAGVANVFMDCSGDVELAAKENSRIPVKWSPPTTPPEILAQVKSYFLYFGSCVMDHSIFDRMEITFIKPMDSYRWVLDTFLETRSFYQTLEPYFVDKDKDVLPSSATKTSIPDRWAIDIQPPQKYVDNAVANVNLPDFVEIMACTGCISGSVICTDCDGTGFQSCSWCHGAHKVLVIGKYGPEACTFCMRKEGREPCPKCCIKGGSPGQLICSECKGSKQLKRSLVLNVKWTTETRIVDTDREEVTEKLLKYEHWEKVVVEGESLGQDPQPLTFELEPSFATTAKKEMDAWVERQKGNPYSKILTFYQRIGRIPVVKVGYKLDGVEDYFFLFSMHYKPYFPNGVPVGSQLKGLVKWMMSK